MSFFSPGGFGLNAGQVRASLGYAVGFNAGRFMREDLPPICRQFYRRLIVSCQAREGEPFRDPNCMARFAVSAVAGGAAGIRANGPQDIGEIRRAVSVPILGIWKQLQEDGRPLITPSWEAARALHTAAGADMVALDATCRGRRYGAL